MEEIRYKRQIQLNEVGEPGQKKIKNARVLVVGSGGLGCPILMYLTGAGIGKIGIMDPDIVTLSNLQRQILFTEKDIGKNKAICAQKHLQKMNSKIKLKAFPLRLTHENATKYFYEFDIIVDGTDNFYSRYLISDQCILHNKIMVYGAIQKFEGQISVFNYRNGPSYRCLFPTPPKVGEIPNCQDIGVLGVAPGIIGILQATEIIKVILDLDGILTGKLFVLDLLNHKNSILDFKKNQKEIDKIISQGKTIPIENNDCHINIEISLNQIHLKEEIVWIDVRETDELPRLTQLSPLKKPISINSLKKSRNKIIAFCQTGLRSKSFIKMIKDQGIRNCFSLKEGAEQLYNWVLKN